MYQLYLDKAENHIILSISNGLKICFKMLNFKKKKKQKYIKQNIVWLQSVKERMHICI